MTLDHSRPFIPVRIAVLSISDSRSAADDRSGDLLVARLTGDGHVLAARELVRDEVGAIRDVLARWIADQAVDCVLTTGGTGVTGRDITPEAIRQVADKEIPGFGEYFRSISAQHIGSSTIQSRALGAVAGGTFLFALPGSPGACKDGWDGILRPQLDNRHRPCNFVELMPRLTES